MSVLVVALIASPISMGGGCSPKLKSLLLPLSLGSDKVAMDDLDVKTLFPDGVGLWFAGVFELFCHLLIECITPSCREERKNKLAAGMQLFQ